MGITFDDGAAYEAFMGGWSRLAGEDFLAWLSPAPGQRWADIGCGNGAFTELLLQRAAPAAVEGIDPSAAQIDHARARLIGQPVTLRQGDAMALPYPDAGFDVSAMALVIFFVPEPARGLAEMIRITRPGGVVAAYAWDVPNGGFPWHAGWVAQEALGMASRRPPSAAVSGLESLGALWREGGLVDVETRRIAVQHRFPDFATYWDTWLKGPSAAAARGSWTPEQRAVLQARLREELGCGETGAFTVSAFASAARGRVPQKR
jgi:SAM-dependent methyltransferase